jgi:hypothetical protein
MKKVFYPLACCLAAGVLVSCSGQKKAGSAQEEQSANEVALSYSKSLKAAEMDSLQLPVDADGYITIFDGKTFNGWRGYGKDRVPSKWTIEDGCIKFNGSGGGEAQDGETCPWLIPKIELGAMVIPANAAAPVLRNFLLEKSDMVLFLRVNN